MVIDFHTHVYPEKVVAKVLPATKKKLKVKVTGTGTPEDLCSRICAFGIARSVFLPLAKGLYFSGIHAQIHETRSS